MMRNIETIFPENFIKFDYSTVDGAIAAATSHATRLLVLLTRRFNGHNNGEIPCSVREAAAWCKCSLSTAQRCFVELQELGLIEIVIRGNFAIKDGSRKNTASTWRLAFVHNKGGRDHEKVA